VGGETTFAFVNSVIKERERLCGGVNLIFIPIILLTRVCIAVVNSAKYFPRIVETTKF
jgi:hypothetical protein